MHAQPVATPGLPDPDLGPRLIGQAARLRVLLVHLTSPALRARVELDDLMQEVFLRALAAAPRLPPAEPEEAALWRTLVVLSRHAVIDCARSLRARKRDGGLAPSRPATSWTALAAASVGPGSRGPGSRGPASLGPADPGPGPATRVALDDERARWVRAFERLSPAHRRVIGLRRFEGLDAAAAGRRLGLSEAAVHSLFRRALQAWERGASS